MTTPTLATRRHAHVEHVMGTAVSLTTLAPVPPDALDGALALLHEADAVFSTYRPDSPLSRLARGETVLGDCPPEVAEVLLRCAVARDWTLGAFDPWRLGGLDPSGLVKGWALQRAAEHLVAHGVLDLSLNGGGDVILRGRPADRPWRVGISDPWRPGRVLDVVTGTPDGSARAVATSGTAERGGHVLDPRTGEPARSLVSATVVAEDLVTADVAATACLVLGPDALDWLAEQPGLEALLLTAEGVVRRTPGWASVAG